MPTSGCGPDRVWIQFDTPEELGWDIVAFALGPEGPELVAGFRRDLADRARWEDDGGTIG